LPPKAVIAPAGTTRLPPGGPTRRAPRHSPHHHPEPGRQEFLKVHPRPGRARLSVVSFTGFPAYLSLEAVAVLGVFSLFQVFIVLRV